MDNLGYFSSKLKYLIVSLPKSEENILKTVINNIEKTII
jgi:hypothetical protein